MATYQLRKNRAGKTIVTATVRITGYPSESRSFDTKSEAKNWARSRETEIQSSPRFDKGTQRLTLSDAIDRYLRDVMPRKRSQAGPRAYLEYWRTELGDMLLSDVSPSQIILRRDSLAKRQTPRGGLMAGGSVNRYLAALSHVFSMAVREWQWVPSNPCARVGKLKEAEGRVRFLDNAELDRLLDALRKSKSPHLLPIVWIAIGTGLRKSNVLQLRWSDVNLETGRVTVERTKNDRGHSLPLVGPALEAVQEWARLVKRADTNLLFPSPKNAQKPIIIGKTFARLVEKAGIQDFHFHDLRHCIGSYLSMSGATQVQIASVLGHKTWAMSARYSHSSFEALREILEAMSEKFLVRPKTSLSEPLSP